MNIDSLWGLKAIGEDSPDDYISWAESQLIRGDNSENILVLAALGLDKIIDTEEVNFYFQRCAQEKITNSRRSNRRLWLMLSICAKKSSRTTITHAS